MPMMPKRVKFRKSQRGKMKGNATRGNTVGFGEYGLQSLKASWITARQIEQVQVLGRDVTSIMRLLPGVRYENTVDSLGMSLRSGARSARYQSSAGVSVSTVPSAISSAGRRLSG